MGPCPHCEGGHKSACYAEYVDGYKCFSCGVSKSYNSHRMAMMDRVRPTIKPGLTIPKASLKVSEWPVSILKWLYGYYVFDDVIKKHRISYIEDSNSLLYKVVEDNEVVFAQSRGFPDKRIKSIGANRPYKIDNGHNTVVLTEDLISAVRVSENGVDAMCLFGTNATTQVIKEVLWRYDTVILWLDNDLAGDKGRKLIPKALNKQINEFKYRFPLRYTQTWSIFSVSSEKDPKEYSDTEIKERLNVK